MYEVLKIKSEIKLLALFTSDICYIFIFYILPFNICDVSTYCIKTWLWFLLFKV